jgi:two-component system sensor histidine kinase/response regulator
VTPQLLWEEYRLGRQPFDLVLMDVQMPAMDGLTATALWRRRELDEGRLHMPVVALTAHALPEDRQRCLAAGMDDHVVKPYSREAIGAAIARWLAPAAGTGRHEAPRPAEAPATGGAAAGAGGASGVLDEARQTQLQQLMGARYPLLLSRAADAIEEQVALIARELPAGDPAAIRDALHRLKNNAGEVGARALHGLVSGLEFTARSELPSLASLAELQQQAGRAAVALRQLAQR